jgi:type III secretion protein U
MNDSEIKQEFKQSEGDPTLKNQRRQLHKEWSTRSLTQATSRANALVINPTHIAIAIQFSPEETPLPMVIAKGEGAFAALMRQVAEDHSIPVVQNVELARGLNEDAELDEAIPEEYFEAVAEVLLWAQGIAKSVSNEIT